VNTKPVALQNRAESGDLSGEKGRYQDHDKNHRHDKGTEEAEFEAYLVIKEKQDNAPGEKRCGLMHIRDRDMTAFKKSRNDACRMEDKGYNDQKIDCFRDRLFSFE
jgi:hypothetical protein